MIILEILVGLLILVGGAGLCWLAGKRLDPLSDDPYADTYDQFMRTCLGFAAIMGVCAILAFAWGIGSMVLA